MFKISEVGRKFGFSRSTLLYYDRIGLLSPSGRSETGYRLYSAADLEKLQTICTFRQAGLTIDGIKKILAIPTDDAGNILQARLAELGTEIRELQAKQRLLAGMLKMKIEGRALPGVDKDAWVEMLRAAGMDEEGMRRWHEEYEKRAPEAHHQFLLSLGISEIEALFIRKWSLNKETSDLQLNHH